MSETRAQVALCDDADLGYARARTVFAPGATLRLDAAYRLAHLPLVAPEHPGVIASRPGAPYVHGRRPPVVSLVLPVAPETLDASPAFAALDAAMRRAVFAPKIAWEVVERRRDRLHATVAGGWSGDGEICPALTPAERAALAAIGPFEVALRGVFSGDVNLGRIYLSLYPERRDGDVLRRIQRALGRRESGLYLVGLWNLTDDLDATETAALAQLIAAWRDVTLARFTATRLRWLRSRDDLVLDGGFIGDAALT
jgi:hypothetical protein